jgi:hypothetical protein
MKQAAAFFLAPLPAAVLGGIVSGLSGGHPRPVSVALFYLLLLYGAQLLFGIAIRLFLLRRGVRRASAFALGGTLMVAVPAIPYVAWAAVVHAYPLPYPVALLLLWLVMGGATGLAYWFIVRPDRRLAGRSRQS